MDGRPVSIATVQPDTPICPGSALAALRGIPWRAWGWGALATDLPVPPGLDEAGKDLLTETWTISGGTITGSATLLVRDPGFRVNGDIGRLVR